MLTSLTADFDEKMKLLLDPNYSGGSDTSSVQSTPSKYAKYRRVSEQPRPLSRGHLSSDQTDLHHVPNAGVQASKTNRSISLGEDSQNVCSEKQLSILNEQQQRNNKKSELKRGRLVDKNHPPKRPNGEEDHAASDSYEEGKENIVQQIEYNSPNLNSWKNLDQNQQVNNLKAGTGSSSGGAAVLATASESNRTQLAFNTNFCLIPE